MNLPRILIVDTYYPDFLKSLPFDPSSTYEVELHKVLDRKFGTADFYSRNLKALGWDAVDVIANHHDLQQMWCRENNVFPLHAIGGQITSVRPDIVFLQDLSLMNEIGAMSATLGVRIAAQCSCPWPGDAKIQRCSVVFTSFPHYVKRIEALGVRAIYNPLAFEPSVLDSICERELLDATTMNDWPNQVFIKGRYLPPERIYDCTFVGGVGAPSHWKYGMEVLNAVAEAIPTFRWWGYGAELLPDGPLKQKYCGPAFGVDMYKILLQSKICLNRHGEVAEGFANNMRMYEATGCGAMLLTDNETDLFMSTFPTKIGPSSDEIVRYSSPDGAVQKIRYHLAYEDYRAAIAARGQQRTLKDHTYAKRMKVVSDTLKEMLVAA